jgi:prophage regulatory protein
VGLPRAGGFPYISASAIVERPDARTGLARSTIYHHIKAGTFPLPTPLGPCAVGWLESDVSNWIAERVEMARDNANRAA